MAFRSSATEKLSVLETKVRKVCIVGAGQLGSRHFQALKQVGMPLQITVVDPSCDALENARIRYETAPPGPDQHDITCTQKLGDVPNDVELCIIATNSAQRKDVLVRLLDTTQASFFILEKLLFQKRQDFHEAASLLSKKGCRAWVNCSLRVMPFYRELKSLCAGGTISYRVTGSYLGLVSNVIHYIDHMEYLTDCHSYEVNTSRLNPCPFQSKRAGFLELSGCLEAAFADGSIGSFTCEVSGDAPLLIEIFSLNVRAISDFRRGMAWMAKKSEGWAWQELEMKIPYQSEMTTRLVGGILRDGTCGLVSYEESMKTHLSMLEPIREFLNARSGTHFDEYPFT